MTIYRQPEGKYKIGLIGFGAIGRVLADAIGNGDAGEVELVAVLRRTDAPTNVDYLVTNDEAIFFRHDFDLVIEAAGQQAIREYAERILDSQVDLLITSMGVLSDSEFQNTLLKSAQRNKVRLLLASGALPAVDWMTAVSGKGVTRVSIRQEKPVDSWRGTSAETMIDFDSLNSVQCFFEGSAAEAASQFPQSSNITAMLALATVGMDATAVRLVADPTSEKMRTLISFASELGELEVVWHGIPAESNPRTSRDVAFTVIKALRNLSSAMVVGV